MGKCRPSKYNVITAKGTVEYGMRCKHIMARRFKTEADRDDAIRSHRKQSKKKSKQK